MPFPQEAVQIIARAAAGPLGGLTLAWQAEHSFVAADGSTQLLLHGGRLEWLPVQSGEGPGASLPNLMEAMLSGITGPGHWSGQTADGVTLADLARDFLGVQDAALAALPDSQMLLLLLRTGLDKVLVAENFSFRLLGEQAFPAFSGTAGAASSAAGMEGYSLLAGRMFDTSLDRAPATSEPALRTMQPSAGAVDAWQMMRGDANGAESKARNAAGSDSGHAASLWPAAQDHDPDPASLSHWTSLLSAEMPGRVEQAFQITQEGLPGPQEVDVFHLH